jgi:hypothetical protein
MSIKNKLSATSDEGWTKYAYDQAKELEHLTGMTVQLSLRLSTRKGVFMLRARLCPRVDDLLLAPVVQCEDYYPRAEYMSLSIAVSRLVAELDRLYAEGVFGVPMDTLFSPNRPTSGDE